MESVQSTSLRPKEVPDLSHLDQEDQQQFRFDHRADHLHKSQGFAKDSSIMSLLSAAKPGLDGQVHQEKNLSKNKTKKKSRDARDSLFIDRTSLLTSQHSTCCDKHDKAALADFERKRIHRASQHLDSVMI